MSQDVTYADVRFVRTPPERSQEKDPSEGELTYENVQGPPCQEERTPTATEGTKESDRRTWYAILALLAACLFLLTSSIGLGVRYWQVSQQLQQANEDGSALEGSLAQTQVQLEEAREELHSTNGTLWSCWAAWNTTQGQLSQANESLMRTQQEKDAVQQHLDQTKKSIEDTKSCQYIGCCPRGWNLFRWKCLWISSDTKSWEDSKKACEDTSSQLLVLKPWSAKQLWGATFIDKSDQYWIGLGTNWKGSWAWVDGTGFGGTEITGTSCGYPSNCVQMSNGALQWCHCSRKNRYICEKNAQ